MFTDEQAVAYIAGLAQLELEQPAEVTQAVYRLGPYGNFVLVAGLQLALRHPDLAPTLREQLEQLVGQFSTPFNGTPGAEILALGNDPARDVPMLPWPMRPEAELRDDDGTRTEVEVAHPIIYPGYRVKVTVDAGTNNYRSTWLAPGQARELAQWIRAAAAEADRLDAADLVIEQRGAEAAQWLRDNPPARP